MIFYQCKCRLHHLVVQPWRRRVVSATQAHHQQQHRQHQQPPLLLLPTPLPLGRFLNAIHLLSPWRSSATTPPFNGVPAAARLAPTATVCPRHSCSVLVFNDVLPCCRFAANSVRPIASRPASSIRAQVRRGCSASDAKPISSQPLRDSLCKGNRTNRSSNTLLFRPEPPPTSRPRPRRPTSPLPPRSRRNSASDA
jgi:hypothetical protein